MKSSDERFSSQDVPLVAYFLACGHKIVDQSDPDNSHRITFTFKKSEALVEDLFNYGNNASMPIQTFYRSLSRVWALIKEKKNDSS